MVVLSRSLMTFNKQTQNSYLDLASTLPLQKFYVMSFPPTSQGDRRSFEEPVFEVCTTWHDAQLA